MTNRCAILQVLVVEKMNLLSEFYFAIVLDRAFMVQCISLVNSRYAQLLHVRIFESTLLVGSCYCS